MEMMLEHKTENLMSQFEEKNRKAEMAQTEKKNTLKARQIEEKIKMEDKLENARRAKQIQEFEQQRIMSKIEMENERIEKFK